MYLGGMLAGGKGFRNPFDRGCLPNCAQFWSSAEPDWGAEYHAGSQVRPPAGCAAAAQRAEVLQLSVQS